MGISLFVSAVIFSAALEVFALLPDSLWGVWFSAAALFFNIVWFRRGARGERPTGVPLLATLAATALLLLFFIDAQTQKQVFIVLVSAIYLFVLLGYTKMRREETSSGLTLVGTATMSAAFLFYTASYAVYINFSIPSWILMSAFFIVAALLSYQHFILSEKRSGDAIRYALLIGIFSSELAWLVNFWPFSYLTTGAALLIFFYVLWDLLQNHLRGDIGKSRVVADVSLLLALTTLVLATARWIPV